MPSLISTEQPAALCCFLVAKFFLCVRVEGTFLAVRLGVRESQEVLCAADAHVEHMFLGGSPVSFAVSSSY